MSDDKIVSILTRLEIRLEARKKAFAHMDMKSSMVEILAETITTMRELGASSEEIVATLRHAASELKDN
jgi:DNA-binding transcriptional regulator YhcF (GntR family)